MFTQSCLISYILEGKMRGKAPSPFFQSALPHRLYLKKGNIVGRENPPKRKRTCRQSFEVMINKTTDPWTNMSATKTSGRTKSRLQHWARHRFNWYRPKNFCLLTKESLLSYKIHKRGIKTQNNRYFGFRLPCVNFSWTFNLACKVLIDQERTIDLVFRNTFTSNPGIS